MTASLDRRDFLATSAAICAGGVLATPSSADEKAKKEARKPLFRISLAQWSLNRRFFGREKPKLDNLDFAKTLLGPFLDLSEILQVPYLTLPGFGP